MGCETLNPANPTRPLVDVNDLRSRFVDHPICLNAIDDHVVQYGPEFIQTLRFDSENRSRETYQWGKTRGKIRLLKLRVSRKGKCSWEAKPK